MARANGTGDSPHFLKKRVTVAALSHPNRKTENYMQEAGTFAHWSLKTTPLVISVCTKCGHFVAATPDHRLLDAVDRAHHCPPTPAHH